MPNISFCGLDCDHCSYRTDKTCVTCREGRGTVCYGRCDVALCVIEKKLGVCQDCAAYPCKKFLATRNY
jgi:hypothetical protein